MAKSKEEQPKKEPLPNHMDKSMFFDARSTGGRENANDIKKFPATSRHIPLAKNEEHFKKQIQIEGDTKKKIDTIKEKEASKKWLTQKGKEAEVQKQKTEEAKSWEDRRKKVLAKGKAASKEAYIKSPDSATKQFNDKAKYSPDKTK